MVEVVYLQQYWYYGSFSSHGINFVAALSFGKKFNLNMPEQTDIYAIEIADNTSFSEECTEKVAASIPEIVKIIVEDLEAILGAI